MFPNVFNCRSSHWQIDLPLSMILHAFLGVRCTTERGMIVTSKHVYVTRLSAEHPRYGPKGP